DVLLFSKPVFGDLDFPSISKPVAFLVVFILDLVGAAILIGATGGSRDSPFGAILFALPALSIFGSSAEFVGTTSKFWPRPAELTVSKLSSTGAQPQTPHSP
ncbi:MAG: hypothetical protein WAO76_05685, partial [Georgfuchsia sp.]